jgi:hypothetical protein
MGFRNFDRKSSEEVGWSFIDNLFIHFPSLYFPPHRDSIDKYATSVQFPLKHANEYTFNIIFFF